MIAFVSNCSHKKKWTPKPDFGYDFAEIFIFVRLKMYTLTTLKSKPLPFPTPELFLIPQVVRCS